MNRPTSPSEGRKIAWQNVLTVFSAAILIRAEVFGAAFAGGWAVASYLDLGPYGVPIIECLFFSRRIPVMVTIIRDAHLGRPVVSHRSRRTLPQRPWPGA